ncbi:MAG TPA: helix-turn-helix domain-containing protein [Actinomycetota bacterium]
MDPRRDIERIALLREPVRRRLYDIVRGSGRAVSREEAAAEAGVSRSLAAFHLDRLADAGLLEVEYRRLSGRRGRGAGRPAKLYRPGADRVEVSFPPTRYALAGDLMIRALRQGGGGRPPVESARASSEAYGREAARELGRGIRRRAPLSRMGEALERLGFEPENDGERVQLRNCPFHELAQRDPELMCAMNQAFLRGLAEGLTGGRAAVRARVEDGYCCAVIEKAP